MVFDCFKCVCENERSCSSSSDTTWCILSPPIFFIILATTQCNKMKQLVFWKWFNVVVVKDEDEESIIILVDVVAARVYPKAGPEHSQVCRWLCCWWLTPFFFILHTLSFFSFVYIPTSSYTYIPRTDYLSLFPLSPERLNVCLYSPWKSETLCIGTPRW